MSTPQPGRDTSATMVTPPNGSRRFDESTRPAVPGYLASPARFTVSMTEHVTTAIFDQLRRIGVEIDHVSEPVVATGFTRASLLEWLRRIPTGAGIEVLTRHLDEHALETLATLEHAAGPADPAAQFVGPDESHLDQRWWPTIEMLDAGIHVLADEWDPIGARLGGVPIEDIGEYVFHLFGPLLRRRPPRDPLAEVSEMIAAIEEDQLGLRRSPLIHRRYLAARLQEIVLRYPLPSRSPRPRPPAAVVVAHRDVGPPPLDPEGVCGRCHGLGTVARVTVGSNPPRITRFCAACWREVRSTYMSTDEKTPETARERIAWLDSLDEPPKSAESRSWDDAMAFIRLILTAREDPERGAEITDAMLAELASEIVADADAMDGPMPDEVERFVQRHTPPTPPI
jgi:hypothetical protein